MSKKKIVFTIYEKKNQPKPNKLTWYCAGTWFVFEIN